MYITYSILFFKMLSTEKIESVKVFSHYISTLPFSTFMSSSQRAGSHGVTRVQGTKN